MTLSGTSYHRLCLPPNRAADLKNIPSVSSSTASFTVSEVVVLGACYPTICHPGVAFTTISAFGETMGLGCAFMTDDEAIYVRLKGALASPVRAASIRNRSKPPIEAVKAVTTVASK